MTLRALVTCSFLLACFGGSAAAGAVTLGDDGRSAPVYDYNQATRERVFIPQASSIDQNGDTVPDKIAIEIIRPKESGPALKMPAIIDPSPYYTTVCRGNEGQCIGDVDLDGLNDKWPLFLGKYFVPRGYAYILAESNGTSNSTGCPLHGGPGDIAGEKSVIDWLNGRVPGYDKDGNAVTAAWHNGSAAMIGKSYDGTLTNGVAATGVEGLKTIVPISAIDSWYAYSRMGGIRFNTHYPSQLSNTVTDAVDRPACAPSRAALDQQDGDATGDFNAFWDARNYLTDVSKVKAAVFATHGLQDDNVKMDHLATWWAGLAANGVPRKLWLLREGHVDPFDSRRDAWVSTLHSWFDHWLYDVPNGIMETPRVDIEDSKDTWNTYADWPLPATKATDVFLQGLTPTGVGGVGLSTGGDLDTVAFTDANLSETNAMNAPTGQQTSRRVFLSQPLTQPLRISGTPQRRPPGRVRQDAVQPRRDPRRLRGEHADHPVRRRHREHHDPDVRRAAPDERQRLQRVLPDREQADDRRHAVAGLARHPRFGQPHLAHHDRAGDHRADHALPVAADPQRLHVPGRAPDRRRAAGDVHRLRLGGRHHGRHDHDGHAADAGLAPGGRGLRRRAGLGGVRARPRRAAAHRPGGRHRAGHRAGWRRGHLPRADGDRQRGPEPVGELRPGLRQRLPRSARPR